MKHFEENYKAYIKENTPDFWDQIEKALPERQTADTEFKAAAAEHTKVISHKMVWRMASAAAGICVVITAATVMNLHDKSADSSMHGSISPTNNTNNDEMLFEEESAAETEQVFNAVESIEEENDQWNLQGYQDTMAPEIEDYAMAPEIEGYAMVPEAAVNTMPYDLPLPASGEFVSVTTETMVCPWDPAKDLLFIGIRGASGSIVYADLHIDLASEDIAAYRCLSMDDPAAADLRANTSYGGKYVALYEIEYSPKEKSSDLADSGSAIPYTVNVEKTEDTVLGPSTEVSVSIDAVGVLNDRLSGTHNDNIAKAAQVISPLNP